MLLGIALHGALAFYPSPWPVHDSQQSAAFGTFVAFVHGFRMQLFFVLSGFFTAMIWRRKGLQSLVTNRAQRVLLPCLLGLVTVLPLFRWVSSVVTQTPAPVTREFRAGQDANAWDPEFGVTPLGWAAMQGDLAMAERLVENGAKVNGQNVDGSTPLHGAAFSGHEAVGRFLLAKGADPKMRNNSGQIPSDAAYADAGTTQFLYGLLRLPARPFDEIQAGRARLLPMLPASAAPVPAAPKPSGVRESYHAFLTTSPLAPLVATNVFDHLWFLWHLCFLVGLFAVWASLEGRRAVATGMRFRAWVVSPRRFLWLVPLTLVPQAFMGMYGYTLGPDTGTGWLPPLHLLIYYGVFFFFGVLYFDADDSEGELGRHWYVSLPTAALVVFPIALVTQPFLRPVSDFLQVSYAWLMVAGSVGLFRRVLSNERPPIRYVSDASYWMYLMHLPLLVALQGVMAPIQLAAPVKFLGLMVVSFGILLLTYQLLVRNTLIGVLLNGRRAGKAG